METFFVGKTIVVTGATSGIGLAVAEALAREGALVIGVGRSTERCRTAEKRLQQISPQGKATYLVADLSLQSQIIGLAQQIKGVLSDWNTPGLDGLVNNAGTFTYWLTITPEGFEMQWAVNHLAAFLLTHELLPQLKAAPFARVVTVSSGSHAGTNLHWNDIQLRRKYNGLLAYQQTKLANVLFSAELNRHLGENSTVTAFAADPGLVKTDIALKGNPGLVRWAWGLRRSGGVSPDVPARGILYLLREPALQPVPSIYWKDCTPRQPSRQAMDPAAAQRLWALSEQMCGISHEAVPAGA